MVIHYVRSTKTFYLVTTSSWTSFCNGSLLRIESFGSDSHLRKDYIHATMKSFRSMISRAVAKRGFVMMPRDTCDIIYPRSGCDNTFSKLYHILHYIVGSSNYSLFVLKNQVHTKSARNMIMSMFCGIVNEKHLVKNGVTNQIPNTNLNIKEDITLTREYKLQTNRKLTNITAGKWGNHNVYLRHSLPPYSLTNMVVGTIASDAFVVMNALTYLKYPYLTFKNDKRDCYGYACSTSYNIGPSFITSKEHLLDIALHNIYDQLQGMSNDIHKGTVWLSDNLTHNMNAVNTSPFSTGTVINLLLEKNSRGIFSKKLDNGNTIYFRVVPYLVGNSNHGGHGTVVAIMSTNPIEMARR